MRQAGRWEENAFTSTFINKYTQEHSPAPLSLTSLNHLLFFLAYGVQAPQLLFAQGANGQLILPLPLPHHHNPTGSLLHPQVWSSSSLDTEHQTTMLHDPPSPEDMDQYCAPRFSKFPTHAEVLNQNQPPISVKWSQAEPSKANTNFMSDFQLALSLDETYGQVQ